METSALQASESCEKKIHLLHLRKGQECTCCMTKTSPAPGAGLAVASSFDLDRTVIPASLLLLCLLLGSHCLGVVKGRRKRRVRSCCTAVRGTHPTQAEKVFLLLFLLFHSCNHAQSGLHCFSDRLSKDCRVIDSSSQ